MTENTIIAHMHAEPITETPQDGAPEWIKILPPPGVAITTHDGRGPYRYSDPQAVIAASMSRKARLVIDENHSTDIAAKAGAPSPARGYVTEMQSRADGIWARVDWTPGGRALMAERAYWGVSPILLAPRSSPKEVVAIKSVALTNEPNLRGLPALHHEETSMFTDRLAEALGMSADTGEDALLERVTAALQSETAAQAQMGEVAKALGISVAEGADLHSAVLVAAKQASEADGSEMITALQSEIAGLTGQVASLKTEQARGRAETFVDGEIRKGRLIPASLRDHYVSRHMEDAATVEKEIAAFGVLSTGVTPQPQAETTDGPRTATEIVAAAQAEITRAKAEGRALDYLTAVRMVTKG